MGAVLRLDDYKEPKKRMTMAERNEKAKKFIPPNVEDVVSVMTKRYQDWPETFCKYMAEAFIDHYEARGWMMPGKLKMVSWERAVSTWKRNVWVYNEKVLEQHKKKAQFVNINTMPQDAAIEYLDKILMMYKGGFKPDKESAEKMYQWLRGMNMMNLPPDAVQRARISAGNRLDHVWMFELKEYLDLMVRHNYTFKQWVK